MQYSPKNLYKKLLGAKGERLAQKFLAKKGYKIIEKNYKNKFAEADLIALYGDFLVFIEVKTRTDTQYGNPREAVSKAKQDKYIALAEYYLLSHKEYRDKNVRFDVVEVLAGDVFHIESAFICE